MDDDIVAYLKEKLKAKNTELYDLQRSILHQNHEGGMPEEEVATRVRAAAALEIEIDELVKQIRARMPRNPRRPSARRHHPSGSQTARGAVPSSRLGSPTDDYRDLDVVPTDFSPRNPNTQQKPETGTELKTFSFNKSLFGRRTEPKKNSPRIHI